MFTKSCQESSSYQVSPFFPDCVISGRLKTRENPKFPSFGWVGVCFPFVFSLKFSTKKVFCNFEVGLVLVVLTSGEKWDYLSAGGHDTANENTKMSFISSTRAF